MALVVWTKILEFLGITIIEEGKENECKEKINSYKDNAKELYTLGKNTFLSNGVDIGSKEMFYLHCLVYYIPVFAADVLEQHGLGVGIFNMQGFERRNKESKNTLKRFSNQKGNVCKNNLKRLYDIFYHEVNSY